MTDETKKNGPDASKAEYAENAGEVDVSSLRDAATENPWEVPADEPDPVELLRAENAELRDRFLRMAAEMENLRRRTERDVKDAKSYSVANFARDMLAVSDNLRREIAAVPGSEERRVGKEGDSTCKYR